MLEHLNIYFDRVAMDTHDLNRLAQANPGLFEFQTINPAHVACILRVSGLHRLEIGEIIVAQEHHVEITRPPQYPLVIGPIVKMTTPNVWPVHPNICGLTRQICYGIQDANVWSPSIGLDTIILIVSRMLRLETFNLTDIIGTSRNSAEYVRRLAEERRTPLDGPSLRSAQSNLTPLPELGERPGVRANSSFILHPSSFQEEEVF